jgi:hypothetical protein
MEPAEEQIVVGLVWPEYELRGIYAVVDKRGASVAPCVVGTEKDGVPRGDPAQAEIAVQREHVRDLRCFA